MTGDLARGNTPADHAATNGVVSCHAAVCIRDDVCPGISITLAICRYANEIVIQLWLATVEMIELVQLG
jgi:hypothetical protein